MLSSNKHEFILAHVRQKTKLKIKKKPKGKEK